MRLAVMLFRGLVLSCALSLLSARPLRAAEAARPSEPRSEQRAPRDLHPRLRLSWLVLQTLPSPGLAIGERGGHGSMTWQITPFLYSWAMDRRLSPVRFFIVEPLVRQSGSVELFVSPEWIGRGLGWTNLGFRAGARAYFPITERGDGWSWSLGGSLLWFDDAQSPSADVGLYTLFGGLGLLVSGAPLFDDGFLQVSLRLRFF